MTKNFVPSTGILTNPTTIVTLDGKEYVIDEIYQKRNGRDYDTRINVVPLGSLEKKKREAVVEEFTSYTPVRPMTPKDAIVLNAIMYVLSLDMAEDYDDHHGITYSVLGNTIKAMTENYEYEGAVFSDKQISICLGNLGIEYESSIVDNRGMFIPKALVPHIQTFQECREELDTKVNTHVHIPAGEGSREFGSRNLYSVDDLCRRFGMSYQSVYNMVKDLPRIHFKTGNFVRIGFDPKLFGIKTV